ncbi:MAG: metal-dependent transcriptional regulator [Christensenellales bacterium]|nr:metal-dependent transcriptional regulator [Eubacteriales bacterium]
MKDKQSIENYLETILVLSLRGGTVRSVDIARELGFTKPSISVAMKKLAAQGYIETDGGLISLTSDGKRRAAAVYERHRVITKALMALGVSEATAKEDACLIEHVISDESFDCLKTRIFELVGDAED